MQQGKKLSGIVYVHRIIDPRMQGSALSNMNMFRRLCGSNCFPNVVLATSFWSEVDMTEGARRERELCETDEFWGQLVKKGSHVARIGLDQKADQRLLLRIAKNKKVVLQAQQEMLDGRRNCETSAAREGNEILSGLRRYFDAQLEAEKENARRKLEEMEKRAEEQIKVQRTSFEESRAREQSRRKYEADNLAMKRDEERYASQQAGIKQLLQAHQVENVRLRKLQQEQQKYFAEYKCIRTRRKVREMTCDKCKQTFKPRPNHYYRKYTTTIVRHPFRATWVTDMGYSTDCCHCRKDNFDHCVKCGPKCGDSEHPPMKLQGGEGDATLLRVVHV